VREAQLLGVEGLALGVGVLQGPHADGRESRDSVVERDHDVGHGLAVAGQELEPAEEDLVAVVAVDVSEGDVGQRGDPQAHLRLEPLDEARVELFVAGGAVVDHVVAAGDHRRAEAAGALVHDDDQLPRRVVIEVPRLRHELDRAAEEVGVEEPRALRVDLDLAGLVDPREEEPRLGVEGVADGEVVPLVAVEVAGRDGDVAQLLHVE